MKEYNQIIRELREDNDQTQKQIAMLLQISSNMYQRYEYGLSEMPARHIKTLALHYKVSADYILGISNKKRP